MIDYFSAEQEFRSARNRMWVMADLICSIAARDWKQADALLQFGRIAGYWRLDSTEAWPVT
jgi:tRNA(Phe) wybutosine-synthesizing methylase Tyw3